MTGFTLFYTVLTSFNRVLTSFNRVLTSFDLHLAVVGPCCEVQMRNWHQEAACCRCQGGIWTVPGVYILATLRRFDYNPSSMVQNDPLIPCERRLAKMEIWEFQELTFGPVLGNRDYDRPFTHILVTHGRFD